MTVTLYCDSDFAAISKEIVEGKVIVFPTDTVYGLGSHPWSIAGIRNCYSLKKRDTGKKMPVLVDGIPAAKHLVRFGKTSEFLASKLWPGKLSIILPVIDSTLSTELVGSDRTLAVRMPNHQCCLRLISACGGSLIGTSANISGEEPFVDPFDPRLTELSRAPDFFLSGSCGSGSGVSSTVIDATQENAIRIVREGAIPAGKVMDYLKINSTDSS